MVRYLKVYLKSGFKIFKGSGYYAFCLFSLISCQPFRSSKKAKANSFFIENLDRPHQYVKLHSNKLVRKADKVIQGQFSFLGYQANFSEGTIIWNKDYLSNYRWRSTFYKFIMPIDPLDDPDKKLLNYDGKLPYELNRFQHLSALLRAYRVTKDEKYSREVISQISNWINNNRFLRGVNWTCAMEVALRACNWAWARWALKDSSVWTDLFNTKYEKSMWQHGWYIEHNLEDKGGIRTNHYLSDIVGLLFIGIMFPEFKDSEKWKNFGVKELVCCMNDMVYPDGFSYENSTGYHRLVMELFTYSAILCKKNNIHLPEAFWQRLEKMFDVVFYCTRPDGRMPMIGDADDGRFFILSDDYDWDRWDFGYLLSIGAVLFKRRDFKEYDRKMHEEVTWLFGDKGARVYDQL